MIINFLPVILGVVVPAIPTFIFLRKKKMPPGLFWAISMATVTFVSIATYPLFTINCTPTICDDEVVWFIPTALVILGFLAGAVICRLTGRPHSVINLFIRVIFDLLSPTETI
ncbi:hypothetical protein [Thermococcus pacificus]|uniref:hypothetical protein n=1 Tax=Thermococcus pacificus TaxID=71998 RepID=UPI0012FD9F0C|nr:hypothetical protein [Thermococcus pacificus]